MLACVQVVKIHMLHWIHIENDLTKTWPTLTFTQWTITNIFCRSLSLNSILNEFDMYCCCCFFFFFVFLLKCLLFETCVHILTKIKAISKISFSKSVILNVSFSLYLLWLTCHNSSTINITQFILEIVF